MTKLTVLFLGLILIFGASVSAIEVLDTAHWVSGMVWQDYNNNGINEDNEPPFPYVKVTLLAQTSSSLNLLTGPPGLIEIQSAFTLSDGSYRFACLSPGYYVVQFETPENRPSRFSPPNVGDDSTDSDVTSWVGRTGTTDLFLAESGGASFIDLGLYQFIFINQFSLTGDQWVPSAPNTARGVVYAALNSDTKEMYYRVIREDFPGQTSDVSAGYYLGWAQQNGVKVYDFADRFSPKENVWLNISDSLLQDLFIGEIYTVIMGNGSFSTLARMRGQFYNFRNLRELSIQVPLSGRNVLPVPVDTSATGMIDFQYNIDRDWFSYQWDLTGIDPSQILSIGIYGPVSASSTAPLLLSLDPTQNSADVSSVQNFDGYFLNGQLYVQINTLAYPNGQLRGNIQNPQPAIYHSAFNLTALLSPMTHGEAVFTLDWRKAELYYYVYIEDITADEISTELIDSTTGLATDLDGPICLQHTNAVKQGFFFALSPEYIDSLAAGKVSIVVTSSNGHELTGTLKNWF